MSVKTARYRWVRWCGTWTVAEHIDDIRYHLPGIEQVIADRGDWEFIVGPWVKRPKDLNKYDSKASKVEA